MPGVISCVTRARSVWRTHAHNRRNATRACSQHAETHHGIHLHSKGVCSCGTSKLLAKRPTSRPSKCIILSVTRVVSGASTHTRTETLRMLTLAPPKRLPGPICTQNIGTYSQYTVPPRERASLGRASNLSPIKMHHTFRALHRS